jgi:hypothetical protein
VSPLCRTLSIKVHISNRRRSLGGSTHSDFGVKRWRSAQGRRLGFWSMTPAEFNQRIVPLYTRRALQRFAQFRLGSGYPHDAATECVQNAMGAMLAKLPDIDLGLGASPFTIACSFVEFSVRAYKSAQGREHWRRQRARAARHETGSRAAVGPPPDEGPRLRLRADGSLDLSEQHRSARQVLGHRAASAAVNAVLSRAEDIERAIKRHLGPYGS